MPTKNSIKLKLEKAKKTAQVVGLVTLGGVALTGYTYLVCRTAARDVVKSGHLVIQLLDAAGNELNRIK